MNAMPLLETFSSHNLCDEEKSKLPNHIFVSFLPPNVTNTGQPADMGIISSIKVGYKVTLIQQLLYNFDTEGVYLWEYTKRRKKYIGCKGVDFGGKPDLIDAMIILKHIWEENECKYIPELMG